MFSSSSNLQPVWQQRKTNIENGGEIQIRWDNIPNQKPILFTMVNEQKKKKLGNGNWVMRDYYIMKARGYYDVNFETDRFLWFNTRQGSYFGWRVLVQDDEVKIDDKSGLMGMMDPWLVFAAKDVTLDLPLDQRPT